MPNNAFNSLVVILGFCLLGLPMILITLSTAPPGLDTFNHSIVYNTIDGDMMSGDYLNSTISINGSSSNYWDKISDPSKLPLLQNITELILEEQLFMDNVSIDDYYGFSKLVHVFELEMTISVAPTSVGEAQQTYLDLFGSDNGTFVSWMWMLDDWNSSYNTLSDYPDINDTIDSVVTNFAGSLSYEIVISFTGNILIGDEQMFQEFSRLIYLDDVGEVLFFLSNEYGWATPETLD